MPLTLVDQSTYIDRAAVSERAYIAREVTPQGLLTNGIFRRSPQLAIDIDDEPAITVLEDATSMFDSAVQLGKSLAKGTFNGVGDVNALLYILSSAIREPDTTLPTNNGRYVFTYSGAGNVTITYTRTGYAPVATAFAPSSSVAIETALNAQIGNGAVSVRQIHTAVYEIVLSPVYMFFGGQLVLTTVAGSAMTSPSYTGTGIYRQTFPVRASGIKPVTFTLAKGLVDTAGEAETTSYFFFTGVSLNFTAKEATMSGQVIGEPMKRSQTLPSGLISTIPQAPIHMKSLNVYAGKTNSGSAGAAMLCKCYSFQYDLSGLRAPAMPLGCGNDGYNGTVATKPSSTLSFAVDKGAEGRAIHALAESGKPFYVLIEAELEEAVPGHPYRFAFSTEVIITSWPETVVEGVKCYNFTGRLAEASIVPTFVLDVALSAVV